MERLFPVVVAMEVYRFLDYESLAVLVHASQSVQQAYEPVALLLVEGLVRAAAGRVGHLPVHNLWKLWRRSIGLLEECLVSMSRASPGTYFTLETSKYRLWAPRGDWIPPEHRPDVLLGSPMVPFMDLLLTWGLDIWTSHRLHPVRFGRVQVSTWELTGAADGWQLCVEVRRQRVRPPPDPQTPEEDDEQASSGDESVEATV